MGGGEVGRGRVFEGVETGGGGGGDGIFRTVLL